MTSFVTWRSKWNEWKYGEITVLTGEYTSGKQKAM